MPTGLRLVGASRDLAPMKSANRCLGISSPRMPTKASAQNGVGLAKRTRTVYMSSFSTWVSLYEPIETAAVAGSRAYSQLNTASSAVKGLPSCHFTPCLSFQVTDLPSAARPPFCTVGISAASTGMRLPSPSQAASGS